VCDDLHPTEHLISLINAKLKSSGSNTLNTITKSVAEEQLNIKRINALRGACLDSSDKIKNELLHEMQSRMVAATEFAGKTRTNYLRLTTESNFLEGEKHNLLSKLQNLIGKSLVKEQDSGGVLTSEIHAIQKKITSLKETIEKNIKQKNELDKEISLHISKNNIAQERLIKLRSEEHNKIRGFLLEKGIEITENTTQMITKHLEFSTEKYRNFELKAQAINQERIDLDTQRKELEADALKSDIEKKIEHVTEQITQISRSLTDYKQRCMRVSIDLGDVSIAFIKDLKSNNSSSLEGISKTVTLLTELLEKVRDFENFSNEDTIRKKIFSTEQGLKTLGEQVGQIEKAVQNIDGLKKKFPRVLEGYIKENLDVNLFNQIYHALNPHRRFKDIDFSVDVTHNKVGINFSASDSALHARPEFLFSSAQLNTFGVSMFLSMALRQNWLSLDTVLLDDPIQNLDDINVLSLIDLLRGLLDLQNGKQIILSTHDERFYHLVKRKFSDYRMKAFRFESYGRVTIDEDIKERSGPTEDRSAPLA
jgi:DNA repair exonuclease SbcCD ATPase subunit